MHIKVKKKATKVAKSCSCCSLPSLEYLDGEIIIFNTHKGQRHINKTNIDWIIDQALKDGLRNQIEQKLEENI